MDYKTVVLAEPNELVPTRWHHQSASSDPAPVEWQGYVTHGASAAAGPLGWVVMTAVEE